MATVYTIPTGDNDDETLDAAEYEDAYDGAGWIPPSRPWPCDIDPDNLPF